MKYIDADKLIAEINKRLMDGEAHTTHQAGRPSKARLRENHPHLRGTHQANRHGEQLMKANELMVGDIVLRNGKPVEIVSTSGIEYSFGQQDITIYQGRGNGLESHTMRGIAPMRITERLLMALGFASSVSPNEWVYEDSVVRMDAQLVPDNHQCIPEQDRTPDYERKDYFKVTIRCEYLDGNLKMKHYDKHFIVHAKDVGEAKERIALLIEIKKKNGEWTEQEDSRTTIRKAVPFEVDCIVPREFSELYSEDTKEL